MPCGKLYFLDFKFSLNACIIYIVGQDLKGNHDVKFLTAEELSHFQNTLTMGNFA